jgi:hypothetical protein
LFHDYNPLLLRQLGGSIRLAVISTRSRRGGSS